MADSRVRSDSVPANKPSSLTTACGTNDPAEGCDTLECAGNVAGDALEGNADMNMMTRIDRLETEPATKSRHLFLDECGNPSDRSGPDLTKARPIGEVVREL